MGDVEFIALIDTELTIILLDKKLVGNNSTNRRSMEIHTLGGTRYNRYNVKLQHYLRTKQVVKNILEAFDAKVYVAKWLNRNKWKRKPFCRKRN